MGKRVGCCELAQARTWVTLQITREHAVHHAIYMQVKQRVQEHVFLCVDHGPEVLLPDPQVHVVRAALAIYAIDTPRDQTSICGHTRVRGENECRASHRAAGQWC